MNWLSKVGTHRRGVQMCKIYAFFCCIFALIGCNTAVPVTTEAKQPSFDSGNQNSGFEGWSTNASGQVFGILSSNARDRYNALTVVYGKRFAPPLVSDAGLSESPTGWLIDAQHLVDFETMNRWRKEGK